MWMPKKVNKAAKTLKTYTDSIVNCPELFRTFPNFFRTSTMHESKYSAQQPASSKEECFCAYSMRMLAYPKYALHHLLFFQERDVEWRRCELEWIRTGTDSSSENLRSRTVFFRMFSYGHTHGNARRRWWPKQVHSKCAQ